ncbi:MAG: hypothetical protein WDM71_05810 [Ferruginibacter sp.]
MPFLTLYKKYGMVYYFLYYKRRMTELVNILAEQYAASITSPEENF